MRTVLIAVDDSKGALAAADTFLRLYAGCQPETVVLLYTEKIEGRSLMDEMLGKAELSTLKEALQGTEHQEALDRRARTILDFFRTKLEAQGIKGVKTVVREGHPAEEILGAAKELGAEMIIIGSRGKRVHTLLMGSVSREIANRSEVPVLIAR